MWQVRELMAKLQRALGHDVKLAGALHCRPGPGLGPGLTGPARRERRHPAPSENQRRSGRASPACAGWSRAASRDYEDVRVGPLS